MKHKKLATLVVTFFVTLSAMAASELTSKVTTETRVQLQAAMRQHIERTSISGTFPNLDLKTGQVQILHPAAGHPMIVRIGEYYVLCADFRDDAGKTVNVDLYLAKKDKGFVVFKVEIANRAPLDALVKSGMARMLE